MAGVPFEVIERLGTPETTRAARLVLDCRHSLLRAREAAEMLLADRENGLSNEMHRAIRSALKARPAPPIESDQHEYLTLLRAIRASTEAEAQLPIALEDDLDRVRRLLIDAGRDVLPRYFVFGAPGVHSLLAEALQDTAVALPTRNKRARERERHLLLYLQRIAGKNDTFSEFGPSGWGRAVSDAPGLALAPEPGIQRREAFMERWTAHAVVAAMNEDEAVRPELAPRLNPNGRIERDIFVLASTGATVALPNGTAEFVASCDGTTPAYASSLPLSALADLAALDVIRWEVEVPALQPYAFSRLLTDIAAWRAGEVRERWLGILQPLQDLSVSLTRSTSVPGRTAALQEARTRLLDLGIERAQGERSLYSALNPIGEECFRECHFTIEDKLLQEVAADAAPWIDLWRDCYAFIAGRVAAGLRSLFESAPQQGGVVSLPAFLHHCSAMKMSLTGPGMVTFAHLGFQEVKAAFRARFEGRPDAAEWEITAADGRFLRGSLDFEPFDEYTFPSADIQLSAASAEAVAHGEYQWILSELHPPPALLHHGAYWSCPDYAELSRSLASMTCGRPSFHFGFFAADFTAHTTVRYMDALPELMTFLAPQRSDARWRTLPPAEVEVFVDKFTNDVGLRTRGSKEYLGSFARAWVIPLGFHPFSFGASPHMPRLRCGRVIVQRQSWTVTAEELPPGDYKGISRDLVLAIEELRAEKGWPRYIYTRPTEATLRRSGAEGRDKDTKPVFIDLESYLSLEIFHRWLVKAGELEITEMLPDPDHLCWQESDGRRTFELRTLIVPR